MLTRKQADNIRNLHNACILAELAAINAGHFPDSFDARIVKNMRAKNRFNKYVESIVKKDERYLDWTTVPLVDKERSIWNAEEETS